MRADTRCRNDQTAKSAPRPYARTSPGITDGSLRVGVILAKRTPAKKRMESALGENRRRIPRLRGSEFPIPCSDETIPCSANNRESPRKLLKLLNDSPPLREQGIPCRRLKLLDELTPTIAERTGNFANSLLFSLLSGNLEPEVGSCRRQGNADDGNARPLHHRTTGPRPGEA